MGGSGGRCDEIIGRLCVWDGGDDGWTPKPEPDAIVERREDFIRRLDSLALVSPGDEWILGQRVRYRLEAGELDQAAEVARACGVESRWKCQAYLGLALHQAEDIRGSEEAFGRALDAMPPRVRTRWTSLEPLLDRELTSWLADEPDSVAAVDRLWTLADPLFLVPGNDRWTGHLSRWAWAMSSERTRSPHQLSWGDDLTESVVRFGWPVAWERPWPRGGEVSSTSAIGHDPPAAVRLVPDREALAYAGEGPLPHWPLTRKGMKSVYLPPYVDSLDVIPAQVGHFRTPGGVMFVAAGQMRREGLDPQSPHGAGGLFFQPTRGDRIGRQASVGEGGRLSGSVVLPAPSGEEGATGVLSLEALLPDLRRGRRARYSVHVPPVPRDVLTLSDVLLLDPGPEPETRDEVADLLLSSVRVAPHTDLRIAFEVYGLGYRPEAVSFQVWLERTDRGFFSRAKGWIGLGDDREALSVSWTETGPTSPQALFRSLELSLPGLEDGAYDLVVGVRTPGRSQAVRRRAITVGPGRR